MNSETIIILMLMTAIDKLAERCECLEEELLSNCYDDAPNSASWYKNCAIKEAFNEVAGKEGL